MVSMHLLVPGAYRLKDRVFFNYGQRVSMHLLVPGAYRPEKTRDMERAYTSSLNAPSGAGCLPTICIRLVFGRMCLRLSQCTFWCRVLTDLD